MASSKPERREEGVATLEQYKTAPAARMLVERGLTSPFEDVRHGSYRTLLADTESEEVCDVLIDHAKKALRKGTADWSTCGIVAVLLDSKLEPVEEAVCELLDKAARQGGIGWELLVNVADELGLEGDDRCVKSLVKLSEQPLFDGFFGARRASCRR